MPQAWSSAPWFFPTMALLHALAAILWGMGLRGVPTAPRERRRWVGLALLAAAWALTVVSLRHALPASWITILQEGFTGSTLRALTGGDLHGGPGQRGFWLALLPGGVGSIRDVVATNLAMSGVGALAAWAVLRRLHDDILLVTALTVGTWLSPVMLSTALSEQPGPLVMPYVLAGVLPATGRWGLGPVGRLILLAVLTLLAASIRAEAATPGLVALAIVGLQEASPRAHARLEGLLGALVAHARRRAWWLAAALVIYVIAAPSLAPLTRGWISWPPHLWWFAWALNPLNVMWITAPALALACLPLGMVALVVRGHARALGGPPLLAALSVSSVLLYQLYAAAAHGQVFSPTGDFAAWEMFRYLPLMLPVWLLLAGWALPSTPSRPTRALWVLALLAPAIPSAVTWIPQHRPERDARVAPFPAWGLVDADVQRQARAILEHLDANPSCSVLTRSRRWGSDPAEPVVDDLLVLHHPRTGAWAVRTLPRASGLALDRLEPGDLPPGGCLHLLAPLDAFLDHDQVPIADLLSGLSRPESTRFPTRPYVHSDHTGGWHKQRQGWTWYVVPMLETTRERASRVPTQGTP